MTVNTMQGLGSSIGRLFHRRGDPCFCQLENRIKRKRALKAIHVLRARPHRGYAS
jgi:hypothetical protein